MKGLFKVIPQHLNQIWVWTLTWPLQNIFISPPQKKIVFLSHSEGDFLVCFGSLSCCITQVPLSSQTDGRTISFRIFWKSAEFMVPSIMASCPGPEGLSHYHHHVWLLVWCSFYEMLCWFYTWYNGTQTFQKVKLLSHQSTKYLPTKLRFFILVNVRWVFVYFLVSSGFYLRTLPWMLFLHSLFLIVESWTLTLIKASEASSSLDVVLGSFMTSWMSRHCSLGVILSVI